jgi:hypothetical protein
MAKKKTIEKYVEEVNIVHNFEYTYPRAVYTSSSGIILVTCALHGDFPIIANNHKNGRGCTKCGNLRRGKAHKKTKDHFIGKFHEKHKIGLYDYSRLKDSTKSNEKFPIGCKVHNEFFMQAPDVHMQGHGCPKCAIEKNTIKSTKSKEDFVNKINNPNLDFSESNYINRGTKMNVLCTIHNTYFKATPKNLLKEKGCPTCGIIKSSEKRKYSLEKVVEQANEKHNDCYGYENAVYIDSSTKMEITCKEHGPFWQTPNNHIIKGSVCSDCSLSGTSNAEGEVYDFINNFISCEKSDRKILNGKELDIYIPSKNIAIEYNGLYWHSDKYIDNSKYHFEKTNSCRDQGIQLIHIFEDEWLNKKEVVKSRLLNLIGKNTDKIYARKCQIKEVSTKEKSEFLDANHLQGKVGSKINLGLYYNNDLVSIMTFGKLRKNLGSTHKEGSWELLRFCNKLNTSVVGGASKLLKYFTGNFEYNEIISYADLRWSNGNLYDKLGFQETHKSVPNYFYVKRGMREPRFKYRKDILVSEGFDKNKTEKQIMKERGYNRIYDCGAIKYTLKK